MLAIVGTVPNPDFPMVTGKVTLENGDILIQGRRVTVKRGTPALLAATIKTGEALGQEEPSAYLIGDIGSGEGSQRLYQYLVKDLKQKNFTTIVFHYLQPHIGWHSRIQSVIQKLTPKPILIADAGFMYVAKMSGRSSACLLYTSPSPRD